MIQEDYVSFETAKLLREKGFDGICQAYYNSHGFSTFNGKGDNYETRPSSILAPTQQMAMKWLRKMHNIFIYIIPMENGNCFSSHVLYNGIDKVLEGVAFSEYEEVVETALKYCLTKLI